jgi:hypothetical protein
MMKIVVFDIHIMRRNEMMLKRSEEGDGGEMKLGFDGKKQLIRFFIELIKSNDMYKTGEGKKRSNFISIAAPKRKKNNKVETLSKVSSPASSDGKTKFQN